MLITTTHWSPGHLQSRFQVGRAVGQGFLWIGLALGSLVMGVACVFLPWWLVLAFVGAVVYPVVLWLAPWAGIALYCVALEVSPDLKISDVMTVASLLVLGIRFAVSRNAMRWLPRRELQLLAAFMALVLLSVGLAFVVFHNTVPFVYRDGRPFMYWLWLPVLYALVGASADGRQKLARVLIGMAVFVAVVALVQYFFGLQFVREGRVGALETGGQIDSDLTRVQMPGFTFVLVAAAWALANISQGGKRLAYGIPLLLLLAAALYVNFGRGLWVWSAVALLLCGVMLGWRRAMLIYLALALVSAVAAIGLYLVKPAVIDAAVHRMVSVVDEGGNKSSFGWRKLENQAAFSRIAGSPLVGIGLGGEYRNWVYEVRSFTEHTRYLHNGYVFTALKLGVPALLILLALFIRIWWRAVRQRAVPGNRSNPVWVAAVASWVALLGLSLTQPEIATTQTVLLMCMLMVVMLGTARADGGAVLARSDVG